jgi:hypothetical protein
LVKLIDIVFASQVKSNLIGYISSSASFFVFGFVL